MTKPIIVSGIQPTNNITLGNYLGAIKNFIKYQQDSEMYIFIADLHAITTDQAINLKQNKLEIAKTMLACGLDPNKVIFFNQSDVLEHTMLGYLVMCNTTIGELNRMTQFKDKSQKCKKDNGTEFIPTGLLTYPALMAADILLYDANIVLVGQDQKQHLELTRNIALRFNQKYQQEVFIVPEFKTNKTSAKIMDLQNPTVKMSKSSTNPKGTIFLNEPVSEARKKIMQALTDNLNQVKYDEQNQPGITNLINIYSSITELSIPEIEAKFQNIKNYGEFKTEVANEVCNLLEMIQTKQKSFNDKDINDILISGAQKAKIKANHKLENVLKAMNFK